MEKKSLILILTLIIFLYWCDKTKIIQNNIQEQNQNKIENNPYLNLIENTDTEKDRNIKIDTKKVVEEDEIYKNKKEWFSFKLPKLREIQERKDWSFVFISSPKKSWDTIKENISINIDYKSDKKTVEEYYNQQKEWIQNHIKNYEEILKEKSKIDKYDWLRLIYKWQLWKDTLQRLQIIFYKEWKFFLITYTSTQDTFDKYINETNNLIKSFKF